MSRAPITVPRWWMGLGRTTRVTVIARPIMGAIHQTAQIMGTTILVHPKLQAILPIQVTTAVATKTVGAVG